MTGIQVLLSKPRTSHSAGDLPSFVEVYPVARPTCWRLFFRPRQLPFCFFVLMFTTFLILGFAYNRTLICLDARRAQFWAADASLQRDLNGLWRLHIRGTKRHLPQCIIIGVRKCGTRALLDFLNLHPQIQIAPEEIHFFNVNENYRLGLEWYRKRMPYSFPQQITMEKTPAYFVGEDVPERIYHMNNSIKLLIVVRDPTTRAISDYTQIQVKKLLRNRTTEPFERLAIDPITGQVNVDYKAIQTSLYHIHMERWLKLFPWRQIHIVDGDALIKDPIPELRKVEAFLGLEHEILEDQLYYNKTRGFYCMKKGMQDLCLPATKGRKHPRVDPNVIHKLQRFFRPHNQKFYKMVGQTFNWP